MSLILPRGPSWAHCTTNMTGTPSPTALGTAVTAGANDTPGTAAALLTNLSHDMEYLVLGLNGFFISGGNGSCMIDILVDPAGGTSWSATKLIPNLLSGQTGAFAQNTPPMLWYYFPLWLKAGSSLGVQAQTAHTADITTGSVACAAFGGNANPGSWWCGKTVEAIGTDATTTQGTSHTPGSTGAYSAWTNFGSTLSASCGALQFVAEGTFTDTTQNARAYFFEFGVNSSRIGPNVYKTTGTSELGQCTTMGPIFCNLPSGTQLMVRGTCSGTVENVDVAAYAVM